MPVEILETRPYRAEWAWVYEAIEADTTQVIRVVEIYEGDGETLWKATEDIDLIDGSVNCDYERKERRSFQLTLANTEGELDIGPDGLWYNKIFKIYRGVRAFNPEDNEWHDLAFQLGEFMIDELDYGRFPNTVAVTGRDYTKRLLNSKFRFTTTYAEGTPLEDAITAIAVAGGHPVSKLQIGFPLGVFLERDFVFEVETPRWDAILEICESVNWEAHFTHIGNLIIHEWYDPLNFEPMHEFSDGIDTSTPGLNDPSNLIDLQWKRRDTRLNNVVIVTGESANQAVPAYGIAENTDPTSPTSIDEVGERVYYYQTSTVATNSDAQALAERFITIMALEEFELEVTSLIYFWLWEGDNVRLQYKGVADWPYRLISVDYPLTLEPMTCILRKVVEWS